MAYEENIRYNTILDDAARQRYQPTVDTLFRITPDMMLRKFPRANVQQGFAFKVIEEVLENMNKDETNSHLLCVGSYEDTCCDALIKLGYKVDEIEPLKNYDLNTFYNLETTQKNHYDVVFSISVMEHVEKDLEFMQQSIDLLAKGGYGVFTFDFNDDESTRVLGGNFKFYSQKYIKEKILPLLKGCTLLDEPNWDCPNPDFELAGHKYTFATLVFQKEL